MLLELAPLAKSSLSIKATFNPRVTASRAIPEPVAPPPIMRRSYSAVEDVVLLALRSFNCSDRVLILGNRGGMTLPELSLLSKGMLLDAVCSEGLVRTTVVAPANVMSDVKPKDLSKRREPTRAMNASKENEDDANVYRERVMKWMDVSAHRRGL